MLTLLLAVISGLISPNFCFIPAPTLSPYLSIIQEPITANGKCIGIDNYKDLYIYDCNSESDQSWSMDVNGFITNAANNGLCLEADAEWPKLRTCDTQKQNQVWTLISDGSPYVKIANGQNCLRFNDNSNRLTVQVCGSNDQWLFGTPELPPIRSGNEIKSLNDKCLDKYDDNTVHLYECNGGNNQKWTYQPDKKAIVNTANDLCLDIKDNPENPWGAEIIVYDCNQADNQIWIPGKDKIIAKNGLCLDVNVNQYNANTNGAAINIYDCHGGDNQKLSMNFPEFSDAEIKSLDNKCLERIDDLVYLEECDGSAKQKWTHHPHLNIITDSPEINKCLHIINGIHENGGIVGMSECALGYTEWRLNKNGIVTLNGKCLDANTNGEITIWDCHGSDNQKWILPTLVYSPVICTHDNHVTKVPNDWSGLKYEGRNDFGLNVWARAITGDSRYSEDCFLRYSNFNNWAEDLYEIDQLSDFIDPNDNLVVFIGGWQMVKTMGESDKFDMPDQWSLFGGIKECREDANSGGIEECEPRDHDAQYWIENGFNVICLEWRQYAEDPGWMPGVGPPLLAESKIYVPVYNGQNVYELLYDKLNDFLDLVEWQGQELRIVGHSLGGQVALNLAAKMKRESNYANMLSRVAVLDVWFSFGNYYLIDVNRYWTGAYARDHLLPDIRGKHGMPAVVESYRSSGIPLFAGADHNWEFHKRTLFVELKPWYYKPWWWVCDNNELQDPFQNTFKYLEKTHLSAFSIYMHCMKFKGSLDKNAPNCRMSTEEMTTRFNEEWCPNQKDGNGETHECFTRWVQRGDTGAKTTWDTDDTFDIYDGARYWIYAKAGVAYVVSATMTYINGNGDEVTHEKQASVFFVVEFFIPPDAIRISIEAKAVAGNSIFKKYYETQNDIQKCNGFDVTGVAWSPEFENMVGGTNDCHGEQKTEYKINAVTGTWYVLQGILDYTDGYGNHKREEHAAAVGYSVIFQLPNDATDIWVSANAVAGTTVFRKYYQNVQQLSGCNEFDVWGTTLINDYTNKAGGAKLCNDK